VTVDSKPMEAKKIHALPPQTAPTAVSQTSSAFSLHKLAAYIADMKSEFYKITWTSWAELQVYTWLVVGATFVLGLGVYAIDVIIQKVLAALSGVIQAIFG
jgi:preprotein translocase subunit SecE